MSRRLFVPSLRQGIWLLAVTLAALGYAYFLRYQVVEQAAVALACEAYPASWLCASRRAAVMLFTPSVFGWTALAAAALNLVRPSIVLCTVGLIAAGLGLVLYNASLAALAGALLILSLARPAPEPE
jgi:hypothetical protein